MKTIPLPDRYQALNRIPEYSIDWAKLENLGNSSDEGAIEACRQEICVKWGVPYPPYPPKRWATHEATSYPENAVEVVDTISPYYPPIKNNFLTQAIEMVAAKKQRREPNPDIMNLPEREGRYLYLRLDLLTSKTKILEEVKRVLDSEFKGVPIYKNSECIGRDKPSSSSFNVWQLYDKVHIEGVSVAKIARKEAEAFTGPTDHLESLKKEISRAVNRARSIINDIRESALKYSPTNQDK